MLENHPLIDRVLRDYLYNVWERDWMDLANCKVEYPEAKAFIDKPTPEQDEKWGAICASCPVFMECKEWADREQITGTYIAGEYRE